MTVRTFAAMLLLASLVAIGCVRNRSTSDDDRFRGTMPVSRAKDRAKADPAPEPKVPALPPTIVPPTPDERPVVPVDFSKPPSSVAIPVAVAETNEDSNQRPIREFIQRRREERTEKAEPKKPDPKADEKPTIPSPFAKDKKEGDAGGVELPSASNTVTPGNSKIPDVKRVYSLAKQKWDALTDYESKLVRKEVIAGKAMPAEEMVFKFRKEPYSVYTKNTGTVGKGRELIYVAGPGARVHILTGEGDNRLVGPGFYTNMLPDDRMMTSKSRHKISEGAIGRTVELFGKAVAMAEAGKYDGLKYLGLVNRKEYADPVEGIEASIPHGQDPDMPKGGKRELYFDANPKSPSYGLPVLIRLLEGDRELEYYCFSDFKIPANLTSADFDPAKLSKKK